MISEEYLAGFFDGDGYVGVVEYKKKHWFTLRLAIINTNTLFLKAVQAQYGGLLRSKGIQLKPHHLPHYHLVWYGDEAKRMARILLQYSIIKLPQLKLSLEFPIGRTKDGRADKPNQEAIYKKLKTMKKA